MLKRNLLIGAGAAIVALAVVPLSAAAVGPGGPGPGPGGPGPGGPGGPGGAGGGGGLLGHPPRPHGHPQPGAAVVNIENGPYGPVLVVGGPGAGLLPGTPPAPGTPPTPPTPPSYAYPAGTSLYLATVDPPTPGAGPAHQYQPGCTTTVVDTPQGSISCTGPETDQTADWPAFTTTAYPVAGPGVNQGLLNAVYRPDLGTFQVTYAGHPLYLFDPGPDSFFGANFYETALPLPPWNTAWYLVTPAGTPASGPATVLTESPQDGTTYNSTVLAAIMLPNAVPGGVAVSVYTFSGDKPNASTCSGACARTFIPLYTVGTPVVGTGANGSAIGVIHRSDGSNQVTYNGHPLYLYSAEQPLFGSGGPATDGTTGNGDGVNAFGGTFSLVTP